MRLNPTELKEEPQNDRTPTQEEQTLNVLIPKYGANKTAADDLDKVLKEQNLKIKELMAAGKLTTYEAGGYKASVSTTEKSSFNMAKLLAVIKKYPELAQLVVKLEETVDMDALESLIYMGKVDTDKLLEMDKCREIKTVTSLRISKEKKKKGE